MDPRDLRRELLTRRTILGGAAFGLGSMALGSLLSRDARADSTAKQGPLAAKKPPLPARAKRVVFLHMAGAPSQLDLFEPKPKLAELDGQPVPESFTQGERFAFLKGTPLLLKSPYAYA